MSEKEEGMWGVVIYIHIKGSEVWANSPRSGFVVYK